MKSRLPYLLTRSLVIDLGTSNTRIIDVHAAKLVELPTVGIVRGDDGLILSIGSEAESMIGRLPQTLLAVHPVVGSAIIDVDTVEQFLRLVRESSGLGRRQFWQKDHAVVLVSPQNTSVQRRTITEVLHNIGIQSSRFVDEPIAGLVGCGVDVRRAKGSMLVDIGAGTTKAAYVERGKTMLIRQLPTAGMDYTDAIQRQLREAAGLQVGWLTAERLKLGVASLHKTTASRRLAVRGKDSQQGLPKQITVSSEQLYETVAALSRSVVDFLRAFTSELPASAQTQVAKNGLCLVGGGSKLDGLADFLHEELKLPIQLPPSLGRANIEGAAHMQARPSLRKLFQSGHQQDWRYHEVAK